MKLKELEQRKLGGSNVMVPAMGIGTMLWDSSKSDTKEDIFKAYSTCLDNGLNFFDTAEIYANGNSERMLGECIKKDGRSIIIASKFAPPSSMVPNPPKRFFVSKKSPRALMEALDNSLNRLGVDYIDLYQLHAPPSHNTIEDYMDVMAEAVKMGKVRAVGVCNFNAAQMRQAYVRLARHDISLATNMVGYSILRRFPETNGVFDICKELNIALIPYAPLAEGVLTGKDRDGKRIPLAYSAVIYFGHLNIVKERENTTSFIKRLFTKPRELDRKRIEPLFKVMDEIAQKHNKTLAQIAINWLITTEDVTVIPIPGVRNIRQINDNMGAVNWKLTKEECELINNAELKTRS
jgi:aryl-alcohol dehydrogenase-like predicted oxidoreductase